MHNMVLAYLLTASIPLFAAENVRKNEAYPVFANTASNNKLPWPDDLKSNSAGQ